MDSFLVVCLLVLGAMAVATALGLLVSVCVGLWRDRGRRTSPGAPEAVSVAPVAAQTWPFVRPYSPVPWKLWDRWHEGWDDWGWE